MRRTRRREKLLIREECGYYKIRQMKEKKHDRKARGKKKSEKLQDVEKRRKKLWISFFSPFVTFNIVWGAAWGGCNIPSFF